MKEINGKFYIEPGDEIEGNAVELTVIGMDETGELSFDVRLGEATELRFWEEDENNPGDGEWFDLSWDFEGTKETNPMYERLYFER